MLKVLLVDDEPYVIEGLKTMLDWEMLNCTVCGTATNGEDAMEMIMHMNPHIVITDINMPVINGLQLIKRTMEELHLRTKFIIVSGYDEFKYVQEAMKFNVSEYILKPVDTGELTAVLAKMHKQYILESRSDEAKDQELKFISNSLMNRIVKGEKKDTLFSRAGTLLNLEKHEKIRFIMLEIDNFEDWMDELDEREIYDRRNTIRSLLEVVVGKEYQLNIFEEDINRYGIVLPDSKYSSVNLEQIIGSILEDFISKGRVSVTVSVSGKGAGIEVLEEMYRQADRAMAYKFFLGLGKIIYFERIENVSLNYDFLNIDVKKLINLIKSYETDKIAVCINEIFFDFYLKKKAPEAVKAYILNIVMEIFNQVIELNKAENSCAELISGLSESIGKGTMQDIKQSFTNLCCEASVLINTLRINKSKDIIYEVKEYVKKNFYYDIKLQKVARLFYISPVYLGKLFKKTTGMQFNEFLHLQRIEQAKRLLRRTDMKIADIASSIGYCDTDYFVGKFKQYAQTLPSEYRKRK